MGEREKRLARNETLYRDVNPAYFVVEKREEEAQEIPRETDPHT